jgi:hypothetical protein
MSGGFGSQQQQHFHGTSCGKAGSNDADSRFSGQPFSVRVCPCFGHTNCKIGCLLPHSRSSSKTGRLCPLAKRVQPSGTLALLSHVVLLHQLTLGKAAVAGRVCSSQNSSIDAQSPVARIARLCSRKRRHLPASAEAMSLSPGLMMVGLLRRPSSWAFVWRHITQR